MSAQPTRAMHLTCDLSEDDDDDDTNDDNDPNLRGGEGGDGQQLPRVSNLPTTSRPGVCMHGLAHMARVFHACNAMHTCTY